MVNLNINDIEYIKDVEVRELTTIKTSGSVKGVFYPKNEDELIFIYNYLKINNCDFEVIGKGSNILFSPRAKDIYIISTQKISEKIKKYKNFVTFPSNISLSQAFQFCLSYSLGGFENLATIPGSIGGAIKINAGCFGDCIFDNLLSIRILKNGEVLTLKKKDIDFGYRYTNLNDCLILSAKFELSYKNKNALREDFTKTLSLRNEKQPKGFSMGSVFKNPNGYSAGYLIEKCGLKGINKNDAIISNQHANFIINKKNASYEDIYYLISLVKKCVKEQFNIDLNLEIKII